VKILAPTPQNIEKAAHALQTGELVAMPTETVYGLAGDALNPVALAKIFNTKERPTFDPLIVHICEELRSTGLVDFSKLSPLAIQRIEKLIARFWPGPLTLVLPKTERPLACLRPTSRRSERQSFRKDLTHSRRTRF
jgi:L-threonylcarbamoyladenylate synthase